MMATFGNGLPGNCTGRCGTGGFIVSMRRVKIALTVERLILSSFVLVSWLNT